MRISDFLVFLMGVHFSCGKIHNIDVVNNDLASATCSCSDFVTPGGYGKCQKTYLGKPICYVNEPTTCPDVVESLYPTGLSWQACLNYNGSNWFYKDDAHVLFEWSSEDKGDQIKIEGPSRLSFVGPHEATNLIRTTKPIPQKNWTSFYFEVEIVNGGSNDFIAIGLTEADPNTRNNCMPGWVTDYWRTRSYSTLGIGYHGDDGNIIYNGTVKGLITFTTGDVVGCLVQLTRSDKYDEIDDENIRVYFTLNGEIITASRVHIKDAVWYPTIGIASVGAVVNTNFGERKFLYSDMDMI